MTMWKWSTTADDNDDADSTINWAEGQAPSSVNNSSRAVMAAIAKYRNDISGNLVTGGSSTAYTITTNQGLATLTDGFMVTARMSATSGATPTLAVDGLTAKQIRSVYGTNIWTGALLINSVWSFVYDSTDDAWIVHAVSPASIPLTNASITGATALTAPATDDELPIYDLSATANKKITTTDLFEVLNAFTEDTAPHVSNDFLLSYDASASTVKKITLSNLVAAFLTAGLTSRNTAKAYAKFTVSGTTVSYTNSTDGFNINTITRSSEGVFAVAFTSALPTANYAVVGSGRSEDNNIAVAIVASSKTTSGFTLTSYKGNEAGVVDPSICDFVVYGY